VICPPEEPPPEPQEVEEEAGGEDVEAIGTCTKCGKHFSAGHGAVVVLSVRPIGPGEDITTRWQLCEDHMPDVDGTEVLAGQFATLLKQ
tara:strand:- start:14987 stop:15253 length:267 start_codon:yes stop_codon:yes gene_type:complete